MSVYIKINDWYGADQDDSTARFTKVFRMTDNEGESAMSLICRNKTWQFEHQTSDSQSDEALEYLTSIGFDVELVPITDMDWDSDDGIGLGEGAGDYDKSEPIEDPKKKQKTALALILILALGAIGLTQTQQGKDIVSSIGSGSKELLASFGLSSDSGKKSTSTKSIKDIPPIEKMAADADSLKYPMTLSGCIETRDKITPILKKADLEQTQSLAVCQDKTISNPAGEWKCEYKSLSTLCNNLEAYSCAMEYQCVTETPTYNRKIFKKQLEALS
jgi:hypothetical protein